MPVNENNSQNMRSMMSSSFGDEKMNKSKELNSNMSISNNTPDEYTRKIQSLGGNANE